VEVDKQHSFAAPGIHGMAISPLLQSLYLSFCARVVPGQACTLLNESLGNDSCNSSQAYRLINHFGNLEVVMEELQKPLQIDERQELPPSKPSVPSHGGKPKEVNYGMFDGGMLPYDDGCHEVKVGRIFQQSQITPDEAQDKEKRGRNKILNSEYIVCEGHYENFITPFGKLMEEQQRQRPDADLVIITDGATWMRQWIEVKFPKAVHILDFYHAFEHLCEFASVLIADKEERGKKRDSWEEKLHQEELEDIIREIKMYLVSPRQDVRTEAEKLLTYLTNNCDRMKYKTYREKGYLIGSGAIESAVSTIVQQRCKLRGQRWNEGAQPVLNLRAIYCSGKGKRMEKIILSQYGQAA